MHPSVAVRLPPHAGGGLLSRRAPRIAAAALLGLLALLLLLLFGGWVFLHTPLAGRKLGGLVTEQVREAIRGSLTVKGARIFGALQVCLDGVELRDPEGVPVLTADSACVSIDVLLLAKKEAHIRSVRLVRPRLEIAFVEEEGGTSTTTLARAVAARAPQEEKTSGGTPTAWTLRLDSLAVEKGAISLRPAIEADPSFALEDLSLSGGQARYAASGAAGRLGLSGDLTAPGALPVALDLDAQLEGDAESGKADLRDLRLRLGESGFLARGSVDLGARRGELSLRELRIRPEDVEALSPARVQPGERGERRAPLLGSELRGSGRATFDGDGTDVALHLDAGGGSLEARGRVQLDSGRWSVELAATDVDPGAVLSAAPRGRLSLALSAQGKGTPQIDEDGAQGELHGKLHVGPARLERMGPLLVDLDADLQGRSAVVHAFSASALGLKVEAHGRAARERLALDLAVDAPHLEQVGRAIAALRKGPGTSVAGAARLRARLTGSATHPDAAVHLRSPSLRIGAGLRATALQVDGTLQGNLLRPSGTLTIRSRDFSLGGLDLGAPRIALALEWPLAHVRIASGVANAASGTQQRGEVRIAGDATIDDDRDGLWLSNFAIEYPGNALRLAQATRVHLRAQDTVIEPLELVSPHGDVRASATIHSSPTGKASRLDAAVVVSRFDLGSLPAFALPQDFHLGGRLDANAVLDGPLAAPDVDLALDLRGGEVQRMRGIDATARAHVHRGRLRAQGSASGPAGVQIEFRADSPLENLAQAAPQSPVDLLFTLRGLDLAKAAQIAAPDPAHAPRLAGEVEVRVAAQGTLARPKATVEIIGRGLSTPQLKDVDAQVGLLVEKGRAALDGSVLLAGTPVASLAGSAPFDLVRALRERGYAAEAMGRPATLDFAISRLTLEQLVRAGALPLGSVGTLQASLHMSGTPRDPQVDFRASGEHLGSGRFSNLAFQTELQAGRRIRLGLGVQGASDPIVGAEGELDLSSAEVIRLAQRALRLSRAQAEGGRKSLVDDAALRGLLDRSLSLRVEVPGLLVGRVASMASERDLPAEGRLSGLLELHGSPASPDLRGRFEMKGFSAGPKALGDADLYVEGSASHVLLHAAVDPPGGGHLLAHASLRGDLSARSLLENGAEGPLAGSLTARVDARKVDLGFLSGLVPGLRRTGGTLEASVAVEGLLGHPRSTGEAHLRGGLFDVVGQGVFDDVAFDATFTPQKLVVDRVTGSTGGGTFGAILVASQTPSQDGDGDRDRFEYSGEIHLGDDTSVRGRVDRQGKPLGAKAVPIREAGEVRADVTGEVDFFGSYEGGLASATAKVADARVLIRKLPDKSLPSLDPNPDVLLVHPGEKPHPPGKEPEEVEAEQKARAKANFRLHLDLDLQHAYVKAEDFEFPVVSQLRFDYDAHNPDRPSAEGTVTVPTGSFSAIGRRFEIENARITETGGDIANPELDLKARYENPQAVVTVSVAGTARDPQLELSSNPPMDQDAIAFFLATGRMQGRATQQGGGVDLSSAASSVVGGLLFGQLRKSLADVLPVDVLTIETNQGGVSQASVGKYIGDRVFVGYRQRLIPAPGENTSEGRVEYEISRRLSAEATVGERNSDVSILYTRDF